jgi:hypothetical protein
MKIFGKSISEYISFLKPILILIIIVGVARLALSLAGVADSTAKWVSLTAVLIVGSVYYAAKTYTSGFGSYRHLLPVIAVQAAVANLIVIAGIAIAMFTGKNNIFSAPEYSGGGEGKTWGHIGGHVLVAIVLPLLFWPICALIMWITKKATTTSKPASSNA